MQSLILVEPTRGEDFKISSILGERSSFFCKVKIARRGVGRRGEGREVRGGEGREERREGGEERKGGEEREGRGGERGK